MKVTEYILQALITEGVDHAFLVPGANIAPFLKALSETSQMKSIVCCHEEGAAFMADGYARSSDKIGPVFAISGPGITNTITGIALSYTDAVPVLAISGEVMGEWEGRGSFQDSSSAGVNTSQMFETITSMHLTLNRPALTKSHIARLFRNMLSHSSKGPGYLAIPGDVMKSDLSCEYHKLPEVLYNPRFLDQEAARATWDLFKGCQKIAILAGTGTIHSGASKELIRFAETFDLPVATTLGAKGVFPEDHPLSLGVLGWFGTRYAIEGLLSGEVEILLVLGSRLTILDTLGWDKNLQPKKALILNDINTNSVYREYKVDHPVLGDANEFLKRLNEESKERGKVLEASRQERKKWLATIKAKGDMSYRPEDGKSEQIPINPARATCDLRSVMPRDAVLFVDTGAHAFIASHYWRAFAPRQFFSSVKYMAPMGWAIAAAIGSKAARPHLPHVVITGDGCMRMHGTEIATAARYNYPVIYVVVNNSSLGNTKLGAEKVSAAMAKLEELPTHNWAKFAESLGAIGIHVEKPKDLIPAYQKALSLNQTVVIDVICGNYPTPTESYDLRMSRILTGKK